MRHLAAATALGLAGALASLPTMAWELRVCGDPDRLPFSHVLETGFENKIATILAEELNAELTYVWFPSSQAQIDDFLRVGECDLIMGVPDGHAGLTSTLAYYRSPFVFVQRADKPWRIEMFDDPLIKELKVGVQPPGGPTEDALVTRGLGSRIVKQYDYELEPVIEDVATGEIDIGLMWGPAAGYFASKSDVPLVVNAVTPEFEPPFIPMFVNMVIGMRRGDEALRDLLDIAIANRWQDIQATLEEFHIPLMPLAEPMLTIEER